MSWTAVQWAMRQAAGGMSAKAVLMALAAHADRYGFSHPSQATLAGECEMSDRSVRGGVRQLEQRGLVHVEYRKRPNQSHAANGYRLVMSPEAIAGDSPERPSGYPAEAFAGDSVSPEVFAGDHSESGESPEAISPPTSFESTDEQMKLTGDEAAVGCNGKLEAIAEMENDLTSDLEGIENPTVRVRFKASARGIVNGDNTTSWQSPEGGQVPWPDRPRLFRLALTRCIAEQNFHANALHSALRYVVPQQLDPAPLATSNYPKPGTPAGDYLAAHSKEDVDAPRRSTASLPAKLSFAIQSPGNGPIRLVANEAVKTDPLTEMLEWLKANPEHRRSVEQQIADFFRDHVEKWEGETQRAVQEKAGELFMQFGRQARRSA